MLSYKENEHEHKPREERDHRGGGQGYGGGGPGHRRLRLRRPMPAEQKWCAEKNLDIKILRETAHMVDEIKTRFMRMNIPERCLNSRV